MTWRNEVNMIITRYPLSSLLYPIKKYRLHRKAQPVFEKYLSVISPLPSCRR